MTLSKRRRLDEKPSDRGRSLLQGHSGVDRDEPSDRANTERDAVRYGLPGRRVGLHELLERGVCCEPDGRVRACGLSVVYKRRIDRLRHVPWRIICIKRCCKRPYVREGRCTYNREQPAVDTPQTLLPHNGYCAVHEAAISRVGALGIVNKLRPEYCQTQDGDGVERSTHLIVSDGVTAR